MGFESVVTRTSKPCFSAASSNSAVFQTCTIALVGSGHVVVQQRFPKSATTGTRVPRNTQAPLTRSASRSTARQEDQSIMAEWYQRVMKTAIRDIRPRPSLCPALVRLISDVARRIPPQPIQFFVFEQGLQITQVALERFFPGISAAKM